MFWGAIDDYIDISAVIIDENVSLIVARTTKVLDMNGNRNT